MLEKATIIRDISLINPHRGHRDILASFALPLLKHPKRLPIDNFDVLHFCWEKIFNVELLNQNFYEDVANWFFWAKKYAHFPLYDESQDRYELFNDSDKVTDLTKRPRFGGRGEQVDFPQIWGDWEAAWTC